MDPVDTVAETIVTLIYGVDRTVFETDDELRGYVHGFLLANPAIHHSEAMLAGLIAARLYLGRVISGESSIKEAVDAVVKLEAIINLASGAV